MTSQKSLDREEESHVRCVLHSDTSGLALLLSRDWIFMHGSLVSAA
jgi:hypothetical protein